MKNRNSFFSQSNNQMTSFANPYSYGFNEANNFYQGNYPNPNIIPNMAPNNDNMYSDYEARFAKIERSITRLNERINKLESSTLYSNTDDDSNNMYII